ncbi:hypothetical protein CLV40_10798 [Actinokineospora auranticolor]|uniref:Uncharacterized protein n=1 Tax=Actinokineospora auranticolor TaxID=155976 RepID=A0A2S6GQ97_9PSEU|nr:hypothetical protein CLV40_10798 [Actinokineospora auranticolor]
MSRVSGPDEPRNRQWAFTLLPAFPILLLVLRLWELSGQDLNTMLLLVQHVNALELASSLVISLLETPPALLLTGYVLGSLSLVSTEGSPPTRLETAVERTPDWAITLMVMWSAVVWQLRFLPALVMLVCAAVGLGVRRRGRQDLVTPVCVVLPIAVGVGELLWFGPAIVEALGLGDVPLALLLGLPPLLGPLLTGPLPHLVARPVTHGLVTIGALVTPFLLMAMFLRVPVLPSVAVELKPASGQPGTIVLGNVVTVDDTMTTMLDDDRTVRFVANDLIVAKSLCQGEQRIPYSPVRARGWLVETAALEWLLTRKLPQGDTDPRCEGRLP